MFGFTRATSHGGVLHNSRPGDRWSEEASFLKHCPCQFISRICQANSHLLTTKYSLVAKHRGATSVLTFLSNGTSCASTPTSKALSRTSRASSKVASSRCQPSRSGSTISRMICMNEQLLTGTAYIRGGFQMAFTLGIPFKTKLFLFDTEGSPFIWEKGCSSRAYTIRRLIICRTRQALAENITVVRDLVLSYPVKILLSCALKVPPFLCCFVRVLSWTMMRRYLVTKELLDCRWCRDISRSSENQRS